MSVCDACRLESYGECDHVRTGKTKKDHASGAWSNRFANIAARAAWGKSGGPFPASSCNGKKNRFLK